MPRRKTKKGQESGALDKTLRFSCRQRIVRLEVDTGTFSLILDQTPPNAVKDPAWTFQPAPAYDTILPIRLFPSYDTAPSTLLHSAPCTTTPTGRASRYFAARIGAPHLLLKTGRRPWNIEEALPTSAPAGAAYCPLTSRPAHTLGRRQAVAHGQWRPTLARHPRQNQTRGTSIRTRGPSN